MLFVGVNLSYQ